MNVSLGEEVSENKLVADVKDIHGQPIGAIRSTTAGRIVSRRSYGSVAVGDIVATVFSRIAD
jgi:predicted deacylase